MLDPSAVVAKEYQGDTVIATTAGRTITGIVKMETDKTLTIQTANETLTLPKRTKIESRVQSKASTMMPEGILEQMPIDDVRARWSPLQQPVDADRSIKQIRQR